MKSQYQHGTINYRGCSTNLLNTLDLYAVGYYKASLLIFRIFCFVSSGSLSHPENAYPPIVVTLLGIFTLVRLLQPQKALFPIVVTLLGIFTLVRLLQPWNAQYPIVVTLLGIFMLVRLLQSMKAVFSIVVTLLGIVMLVKLLQPLNALSLIVVTLLGMIYSFSPAGAKAISLLSIIRQLPSADANLPLNSLRLLQP